MRDKRALLKAWTRAGSVAVPLDTLFLHGGETRRLPFGDHRNKWRPCMSLVAVAERHVRFTLRIASAAVPVESRAGVAEVVDCDASSLLLPAEKRRLELSMVHGRGAIELIRVTHAPGRTPVDVVLPERAMGWMGEVPASTVGQALAPAAMRMRRARRAAQLAGARILAPVSLTATDKGSGAAVLELAAGCHRLHVVADTGIGGAADVDADARRQQDGVVLARDRSHAPDARLSFCVGAEQRVALQFAGAPQDATVWVLDAFWPIPVSVPVTWGAHARAGIAWALHRRTTPTPRHPPEFQWLGAAGVTVLPVPISPGVCYLVAFAIARGQAATARVTASAGERRVYDGANDPARSAALTFCAPAYIDSASLTVDVRSRDAWWVAMVWRLGGRGAR